MVTINKIEFVLLNKAPLALRGFTGELTLALVLRWISSVDSIMAANLHNSKKPKPLSVSPLYIGPTPHFRGTKIVGTGHEIRFYASCSSEVCNALLEGALRGGSSRLGNTDVELLEAGVTSIEVPHGEPPNKMTLEFLTPTRFAKKPILRRKRPYFDFCPTPFNVARSAYIHWRIAFGNPPSPSPRGLLKWVYNYVYMADMYGRVAAAVLKGRPQLGFVGRAVYEIKSESEKRKREFWALLQYAELMNVGTSRSIGFGHFRIKAKNDRP